MLVGEMEEEGKVVICLGGGVVKICGRIVVCGVRERLLLRMIFSDLNVWIEVVLFVLIFFLGRGKGRIIFCFLFWCFREGLVESKEKEK